MTVKAFEAWFEAKNQDANERNKRSWVLAAIRAHRHWGEGKEITEEEYDSAVAEVEGISLGGGKPETLDTPKP